MTACLGTVAVHLLVFLVLCSAFIVHASTVHKEWEQWKLQYGKNYSNTVEEQARKGVWIRNYHRISWHNQQQKSFSIAPNQFADLVKCYNSKYFCMTLLDCVLLLMCIIHRYIKLSIIDHSV